ncbi:MAG: hypothetical protein WCH42_08260, partial [Actinomycetes bacterium]
SHNAAKVMPMIQKSQVSFPNCSRRINNRKASQICVAELLAVNVGKPPGQVVASTLKWRLRELQNLIVATARTIYQHGCLATKARQ